MEGYAEHLLIPGQPQNEDGPLFDEPWQLTAFGIVIALHQNGHFAWPEWVERLGAEIALRKNYGLSDHNSIYYHQWLAALESLVVEKKLSSLDDLLTRKEEWRHADEHRDFGKPLSLPTQGLDQDEGHHDHELNETRSR